MKNKDDEFIDSVYELAEEIDKACEGKDHYLVMCSLIETLTEVLLEMEGMDEYQEENHPGKLFANIFNQILTAKREMIELEALEEEREGATIH